MIMIHKNPHHFVQIVENALNIAYNPRDQTRWIKIHDFYTLRYLNPDSPEKENFKKHGYGQNQ